MAFKNAVRQSIISSPYVTNKSPVSGIPRNMRQRQPLPLLHRSSLQLQRKRVLQHLHPSYRFRHQNDHSNHHCKNYHTSKTRSTRHNRLSCLTTQQRMLLHSDSESPTYDTLHLHQNHHANHNNQLNRRSKLQHHRCSHPQKRRFRVSEFESMLEGAEEAKWFNNSHRSGHD